MSSSSVPVARKRNAVLISLLVIGVIIVGAALIAIETNSSVASFAQGLVGESNISVERPSSESIEQDILRNSRFIGNAANENIQVPSTSGHLEQTQAMIKEQSEYTQELFNRLFGKDQ